MSVIPLLCPECGYAVLTPRQPADYPETVRIETLCPECAGGDFAEVMQFDRQDQHITRDPDECVPAQNNEGGK